MIVVGHEDTIAKWVALNIPEMHEAAATAAPFGPCKTFGVIRDDELVGGVVFHDWQPQWQTIMLSGAAISRRAALPGTIRAILGYPFRDAGAYLIHAKTRSGNDAAARFLKGLGFKPEAILRHRFGKKQHELHFSLTAPEFKRKWGNP